MIVQSVEPSVKPTAHPDLATLPLAHRRIVLTGFMGAGKTTVGRLLAAHLGWEFLDLDALIEVRAGLAVPDIFASHGEPHFRKLESQALASALGRNHIVLALGGGAPETLTNRLLLEQTPATTIVFLDAPFAVLYDRCMLQALNAAPGATPAAAGNARPNLADAAAAQARFLTREPIYRRLARHAIATAELTTAQTVDALIAGLCSNPPSRRRSLP